MDKTPTLELPPSGVTTITDDIRAIPTSPRPNESTSPVETGITKVLDMPPVSTRAMTTNTPVARAALVPIITEPTPEDLRRQPVYLAAKNKYYPAPVAYDDAGPFDNSTLYGQAPWFDMDAVLAGHIIPRYEYQDFLPGGIPLSAMATESWRRQYCCYDSDLRVGHGRTLAGVRTDFAKAAYAGLNRFLTFTPIPDHIRADLFLYRTQGEIEYVNSLHRVSSEMLEGWRGHLMVSNDAMMFTKPCLRAEFRYFRKNSAYWKVQVKIQNIYVF